MQLGESGRAAALTPPAVSAAFSPVSRYRLPGSGRQEFVRDAGEKQPLVMLASLVGALSLAGDGFEPARDAAS